MARITVEDCLERIDNRFDLVLVAARRAHMLKNGAAALLPWDNDKPAVLALREIAEGKVTPDILDQPLQTPEDEADMPDLETLHRQAAEMVVEDVSAAQEDDEDFDDEFEVSEEEGTDLSVKAKPEAGVAAAGDATPPDDSAALSVNAKSEAGVVAAGDATPPDDSAALSVNAKSEAGVAAAEDATPPDDSAADKKQAAEGA